MTGEEKWNRCAELIEVLGIKFKRKKGWERRADTTWGTKTRLGLIDTICRIMYDKKEKENNANTKN